MSDPLAWERCLFDIDRVLVSDAGGYRITKDQAGDDVLYRVYWPGGYLGNVTAAYLAKAVAEAHRHEEMSKGGNSG